MALVSVLRRARTSGCPQQEAERAGERRRSGGLIIGADPGHAAVGPGQDRRAVGQPEAGPGAVGVTQVVGLAAAEPPGVDTCAGRGVSLVRGLQLRRSLRAGEQDETAREQVMAADGGVLAGQPDVRHPAPASGRPAERGTGHLAQDGGGPVALAEGDYQVVDIVVQAAAEARRLPADGQIGRASVTCRRSVSYVQAARCRRGPRAPQAVTLTTVTGMSSRPNAARAIWTQRSSVKSAT